MSWPIGREWSLITSCTHHTLTSRLLLGRLRPLCTRLRLCYYEVGALHDVIVISMCCWVVLRWPWLQRRIRVVRVLLSVRGGLIPDLVAEMDLGLDWVRVDHRDSFWLFGQEGIRVYRLLMFRAWSRCLVELRDQRRWCSRHLQLLFATRYAWEMLMDCSEVFLTLLLGLLTLSLKEFFLLCRAYEPLIKVMVAIKEIILLAASFLSRFKSSPTNT